jgi:hypothetical protein
MLTGKEKACEQKITIDAIKYLHQGYYTFNSNVLDAVRFVTRPPFNVDALTAESLEFCSSARPRYIRNPDKLVLNQPLFSYERGCSGLASFSRATVLLVHDVARLPSG